MKLIVLLTLALAICWPTVAQTPASKPHVAVSGVVVGHSVEYVAVRDTNAVPQFRTVRNSKGEQRQLPLAPKQVSRLTYVRGVPDWRAYSPGQRVVFKDCVVVSASEALRSVQLVVSPKK